MVNIQVKKVKPDAILPSYAHPGDAGMDVFSAIDIIIPPHDRVTIPLGISIALPAGYVSLLWDKSGLASKSGLTMLAGVIDAHYRGEYMVVVYNTTSQPYNVVKGQKIAQLLIQPVETAVIEEVPELSQTQRAAGGFGSTGLGIEKK